MADCIFCKIIRGELPCSKVYEDDKVVAFLDIHPVRDGHTLVVPKIHCDNLLDCDPEVLANMIRATQKVARAVVSATGASGFNLGVNSGRAAGQVIFHLHLHIIPRMEGDGLRLWPSREYGSGEMQTLAERIKQRLRSR
ncbi:MAG: Histidine triad (HIT) protein [Parcubacteria group bacterium GW2011_GWA2_47_26]|nr:MAG: Histidine triad (HIT) protein [Parcubacteria group bacterium GW2011_GWA2_47_26]